jgi:glycosyltransferase involved in cell wall biosynthesis
VAFIKLASKRKVVFDPLISKYMTRVLDYGVKWKGPHKYLVDWLAFYWPDILIWDSLAHQNYLKTMYSLKKPMKAIYIGADTSIFYPIPKQRGNKITIGFYGSFNPLQGIDKIVKAAHILKSENAIQFKIIGTGSTYKAVRKLSDELDINNITFASDVPYDQLNAAINEFDICLGVFGDSKKTDVVIPNKIYHYAAARKCIITKDTIAIRELFEHKKNIFLVENSPEKIAKAILKLAKDQNTAEGYASAGYDLVSKNYNQDKVAESFVDFLRTCS